MKYSYKYPRPALTVDCVVIGLDLHEKCLKILLIQRKLPPFKNKWALPGGFMTMEETLEEAASRELQEETGLKDIYMEQLAAYSQPKRDPRDRVVTVAFVALVKMNHLKPVGGTDASDAAWFTLHNCPALAFDHQQILTDALLQIRSKIKRQPLGFELLPKKFSLTQLQQLYEIVLEDKLDKRNFRKKILSYDLLIELNETQSNVAHRAARLYSFNKKRYLQLAKSGFHFEI